jgi:hypothetical protein
MDVEHGGSRRKENLPDRFPEAGAAEAAAGDVLQHAQIRYQAEMLVDESDAAAKLAELPR